MFFNKKSAPKTAKNKTETTSFKELYPIQKLYNQNNLIIELDYIKHSTKYSRSYYLIDFPSYASIENIIKTFDLSNNNKSLEGFEYTLKLIIKADEDILLDKTIKTIKYNLLEHAKLPFFGGSEVVAKTKIDNIEEIEKKIAKGIKLNTFSFVLTVFTKNLEDLNIVEQHIQSKLRQKDWSFVTPLGDQKETFLNSLPLPSVNSFEQKILSDSLAGLVLPTSTRGGGLLPIGFDINRRNLYFFDIFKDDRTHSICVTGDNGSGKSAFCKKIYEEMGLFGVQRWYIDSEGECLKMASYIKAKVITINRSSGLNIIDFDQNIFEFFDQEDKEKYNPKIDHINWLANFMLGFPVFSDSIIKNRTPLLNCLSAFYNQIDLKKSDYNMSNLCNYLKKHPKSKGEWSDCLNGILNFSPDPLDNGTYGGYFSSSDPFDIDHDAIIFDISNNENEQLRSALSYVLLYKTFEKILTKDRYRCLFIDELHLFLKFEGFTELLSQYTKRCRKYNGFYVLITQELNDYKKYNAISIIKQMGFHFIFAQENIDDEIIALEEHTMKQIKNLKVGTCKISQKKVLLLEDVNIYLQKHQIEYCKKDNPQDLSINMAKKYD